MGVNGREFILRKCRDDKFLMELQYVAHILKLPVEDAAALLLQTAVDNFDDGMGKGADNVFAIDCLCCRDEKHEVEGSERG